MKRCLIAWVAGIVTLLSTPLTPGRAETSEKPDLQAAITRAYQAATPGPTTVRLGETATLAVPKGLVFVPVAEAEKVVAASGNTLRNQLYGIVMIANRHHHRFMVIAQHDSGPIAPDVAAAWDKTDILEAMREGMRRGNDARAKVGAGRLGVADFVVPPTYDGAGHRLHLASRIVELGPTTSDEDTVVMKSVAFTPNASIDVSYATGLTTYKVDRPHFDAIINGLRVERSVATGHSSSTTGVDKSHLLPILFGGETRDSIAAEMAAMRAADAERRATAVKPKAPLVSMQTLMLIGGIFVVLALGVIGLAMGNAARQRNADASNNNAVERALRRPKA